MDIEGGVEGVYRYLEIVLGWTRELLQDFLNTYVAAMFLYAMYTCINM